MSNCQCSCKNSCIVYAVGASIILGLVTFVLSFTATITVTSAFLWVLLGIGVVTLVLSPVIAYIANQTGATSCVCSSLNALLWGLLGTILFSVILLAITFPATSILGAVILGVLIGFTTLALTSLACIAKCIANCDCIIG